MTKAGPKRRRDDTCALRTCRRPLPALAVAHGDPFHASKCCRDFYGVPFLSDEGARRYEAQGRKNRKPTENQKRAMGKGLKLRKGK